MHYGCIPLCLLLLLSNSRQSILPSLVFGLLLTEWIKWWLGWMFRGAWRKELVAAVFLTFVGLWHSKQSICHSVSYVELHRGRVQWLGATIVLVSGWRCIIISFSAPSTCHREKLPKHRQPDGGTSRARVRLQITQSNFTVNEMGFICKYGMKWRLLTLMF